MSSDAFDESSKIITYVVACVILLPILGVVVSVFAMVWRNSIKPKNIEPPTIDPEVGDTDTIIESEDTDSFIERRIILANLVNALDVDYNRDLPPLPNNE